ncbi:hypothetical protein LP7551_03311 [Roseibium album]|nr:hypothetical protein LP7551_03311 [Roseibium album]
MIPENVDHKALEVLFKRRSSTFLERVRAEPSKSDEMIHSGLSVT